MSTPTTGALPAAGRRLGALAAAVRTAPWLGALLGGLDMCGFGCRSLVGRDFADQFRNRLRRSGDLLRGDGNTGSAHECRSVSALFGKHHGDDVAGAAGAGGTPGAVQVCLVLGGRVDVHHQLHVVDVHTAGSDVGSYQHAGLTGSEGRQVAVASRLRKVAVQVN